MQGVEEKGLGGDGSLSQQKELLDILFDFLILDLGRWREEK